MHSFSFLFFFFFFAKNEDEPIPECFIHEWEKNESFSLIRHLWWPRFFFGKKRSLSLSKTRTQLEISNGKTIKIGLFGHLISKISPDFSLNLSFRALFLENWVKYQNKSSFSHCWIRKLLWASLSNCDVGPNIHNLLLESRTRYWDFLGCWIRKFLQIPLWSSI